MRVLSEFAPADVASIAALATEVEAATGIVPFSDDAWSGMHAASTAPGPGRDRGLVVPEGDGTIGAYAHLAHHHAGEWSLEFAVRPGRPDLRPALLDAAVDVVGKEGGGHVTLWSHGVTPADDELARGAGFAPERELLQLRVPLPLADPPRWPDGVRIRPFVAGQDEAAWVAVNNRAFAGHPEQGDWTIDTLRQRETEPWFDPAGFLLAFDADGLAGSCWTKVHPAQPPREPVALGEIYVIGADPARHGKGLGRALTAGGLASLADRGITLGMLFVDTANEAAVALYRSLGFTTHRTDRAVRARRFTRGTMTSRYGASRAHVDALMAEWGEPRYRADQLWDALYRQQIPLDDATALPKALRERIAVALPLALTELVTSEAYDGFTTKWLWGCASDGAQIETVLMRYPTRATVCVSSQAGCAMGCTFCATGQAGFDRHLDPGEIVEQVLRAADASPQRVSNVVFMGMGEPLANYDNTWAAIERLHGDLGLSARRITVSTVGVAPAIRRLASEALPVTLAVSLHAPTDAERSELVPLNRRYPIAEILDAASEFAASRGRRVTFEYACIDGVNDTGRQAEALGRLRGRSRASGAPT